MEIIISKQQQKLIKENSVKDDLTQMIKDGDWRSASELVGGAKNLKKLTGVNTPMGFLHLYDDLDVVQSEIRPDWTLFRDKPEHNLMIHYRKNGCIYFSYDEIWKVLEDDFGLNHFETQKLTKEWMSEVYNLSGISTQFLENLAARKLS